MWNFSERQRLHILEPFQSVEGLSKIDQSMFISSIFLSLKSLKYLESSVAFAFER